MIFSQNDVIHIAKRKKNTKNINIHVYKFLLYFEYLKVYKGST